MPDRVGADCSDTSARSVHALLPAEHARVRMCVLARMHVCVRQEAESDVDEEADGAAPTSTSVGAASGVTSKIYKKKNRK